MADGAYEPFPPVEAWAAVPFDTALYEQYAALLDAARAEASDEARERAVRQAIRYAGTDTGAIEGLYTTDRGFTRTVAVEAAAWEAAANERGPNAAEIIKDQIAAYEWVLDLVTQKVAVTEHVVRELHAMLCRSQETYVVHTALGRQERPLPKGEYKTFANNPTLASGRVHHYAPPDEVPSEMHRLVASMGSAAYEALHPVLQSAYVHYALAAIHPFADGNGRTARALASVPLYRDRRVPLMVLADERDAYLDALGEADGGNLGAFVSFVADRVVDVLALAELTMRAGASADTTASLEALRQMAETARAYDAASIDTTAGRLSGVVRDEVSTYAERLADGGALRVRVSSQGSLVGDPRGGYRRSIRAPATLLTLTSPPVRLVRRIEVLIPEDDGALVVQPDGAAPVAFARRELEPSVRSVAKIKVAAIVEAFVSDALARLASEAEEALRGR